MLLKLLSFVTKSFLTRKPIDWKFILVGPILMSDSYSDSKYIE